MSPGAHAPFRPYRPLGAALVLLLLAGAAAFILPGKYLRGFANVCTVHLQGEVEYVFEGQVRRRHAGPYVHPGSAIRVEFVAGGWMRSSMME